VSNGAQIGGVIGAAVGAYFGGPQGAQLGYMIGSTVGGYIDPAEIFGPQLRDAATQTAMDGVPRAYGYGTFPCAGNLIWCSDLTMREKTESSKGAPTETVTYHYYRSYAIAVCEGPAHGNGIAGYRIIKRNGKVVYDTRTDDELSSLGYSPTEIAETRAAQTKFTQRARLYYGVADQLPDPTIQAVKGVDEVPGYSYTAYIVVADEDLTELRGAVPQYEFVVSVCGNRTDGSLPQTLLVTGSAKTMGGPTFATATTELEPEFVGIAQSTGADIARATPAYFEGRFCVISEDGVRYTDLDDIEINWDTGVVDSFPGGYPTFGKIVGDARGWLTVIPQGSGSPTAFISPFLPTEFTRTALSATSTTGVPTTDAQKSPNVIKVLGGRYVLCESRSFFVSDAPEGPYQAVWDANSESASGRNPNGASIVFWNDILEFGGNWYAIISWHFELSVRRTQIIRSHNGFEDWSTFDILVDVGYADSYGPIQLCATSGAIVACTLGGSLWTSANLWVEPIETGLNGPGSDHLEGGRRAVASNGLVFCISADDKAAVFDPGTMTVGELITLPIASAIGIAVSTPADAGIPIPDAPGYYIDPVTEEIFGPTGTTISECAPSLAEIVEDQCALRDVTTVDAADLEEDYVLGFRIANTSSPQKNIQAAMPGYFFDSSEFDGVQHFVKRGGEDSFHIPYAEMCTRDGDTVQWERTQEAELLRKVTFTYFDPRATYTPTSQTGERRAGTIQAMGESASQLPIVGTGAWAAQAADINLKAAWTEPDECTLHVSLDWAELVTAAVGTIEDERGTIHRVRIEEIKDDGLLRMITARRTDSAAYQSNAAGKPIPLPTFPGSDIRGPVFGALMNSPVIVDTDDRPGIYWAAGGVTTGYLGASLQLLRAGAWVELGQILGSSTIGSLAEALPYHAGDIDTQNVLHVTMRSELSSTTFQNLLGERNAVAIIRADGSVEIVQFQTATPASGNTYELRTLIRNRLNTYGDGHAEGATVVLLDDGVSFASLRPEEIGQVLSFRMVSLGTNADSAPIVTLDLSTMYSQTEWPVTNMKVVKDGDDYTVTWLPRHRLGSDAFPVRSANWAGYLVSWQHSDQFHEEVVTTESITFSLPGASDIDFSVSQINQFSGPGPATTVNIQ
jgi:hypothetical protein